MIYHSTEVCLTLRVSVVMVFGQLFQLPAKMSRLIHTLFLSNLQQHVLLHQLLQPSTLIVPVLHKIQTQRLADLKIPCEYFNKQFNIYIVELRMQIGKHFMLKCEEQNG